MPHEGERDRDRDRERRHRDRERRQSRGEHTDAERRRRRGHRATDSQGEVLPRAPRNPRQSDSEWESPSPRKKRHSHSTPGDSTPSGSRGSAPLSLDAIAKLDKAHQKKAGWRGYDYDEDYLKEVRRKEKDLEKDRVKEERGERKKRLKDEERRREAAAEEELRIKEEEVRRKEAKLERERLRAEKEERRKARERANAEEKRRAYESDVVAEEEAARIRRERRIEERERSRRMYYTDAEESVETPPPEVAREERRRKKETKYTPSELDEKKERRRRYEERFTPSVIAEKKERRREEKRLHHEQKKRRVISGPLAEEGGVDDDEEYQYMMEKRGGAGTEPSEYSEEERARKKKLWKRIAIGVVSVLIILAIVIPVAVLVSKNKGDEPGTAAASDSGKPANSNLDGIDRSSIPNWAQGTILDPFDWYDTADFNVTFTNATVGGLPLMGLNSEWNDDIAANDKVPKLSETFEYGKMKFRGVNVGGWLNIEPFITPSLFEQYSQRDGIIDEYTLCTKLGTDRCKTTLEQHYSTFVTKETFADIRDAGFDHVRIPFGYWAVTTYEGDPYVKQVAWRYLLRGIEYARQNGLRVNLDLHGAPGSQNGWNHSGRQGAIGWLNGTDGDLNAQRTLDIHHQLSQFFSRPRYKNIVTMYGLVNEPRMVDIDTTRVIGWTEKAIKQIRGDNITAVLVFGDGFYGLDNWQGKLQDYDDLLLDVHQYVIFNVDQLSLNHTKKLNFACEAWTTQSKQSMDTTTGFGPTMCGEWSQADTDCAEYINNVNMGTRWEGTYDTRNSSTSVLTPQCPTPDSCTCDPANADPSTYSDAYKKWLYQFAVAQMISFEVGWGWFYWTWDTEKATQWSYKKGMKAGIMPDKVWNREFDCPDRLEDFGGLGLSENY